MDRRSFLKRSCEASVSTAAGLTLLNAATPTQAQAESRRLNLRITDVRTIVMNAGGDENYVFVKVDTNQGITGLGDAAVEGSDDQPRDP
jgi:anaerobic selenocysteine-containing dehydrogenase